MDDLEKEARNIANITKIGVHNNIITITAHGTIKDYYFIDMELCDLNLHDYIYRETPPEPSESIPYFVKGEGWLTAIQIWNVMRHIAAGVEYIHLKGHIHRDIKPRNGIISRLYQLMSSSSLLP
jgi:serine/threonine protein kinase